MIACLDRLRAFARPDWKYHHPVSVEQLAFAGTQGCIRSVSFYHGGDVLYELVDGPGFWHEDCLEPTS
jgi:hypothetical protein